MTDKVYRSAQGKMVDLGALILQNETTRAVGNMGVNARGDRVDADGNIISSRGEQVSRSVKQSATNVKSSKQKFKSTDPTAETAQEPSRIAEVPTAQSPAGLAAAIDRVNKQ
jgi:hypothetical protein